jgi:hypothetical protein
VLKNLDLHFIVVDLGEVEIMETLSAEDWKELKAALLNVGLELMDDKRAILIEQIKKSGNKGAADYWAVEIDTSGTILWEKTYGGNYADFPYQIDATVDGGILIGGNTNSTNGDISGVKGRDDYWIVKIKKNQIPTDIVLDHAAISENTSPGTFVGRIAAVDNDENEPHFYHLTSGDGDADNSCFASLAIRSN